MLARIVSASRCLHLGCQRWPTFDHFGEVSGKKCGQGVGKEILDVNPNRRKSLRRKYARGDLNPQPSAPEADALSS